MGSGQGGVANDGEAPPTSGPHWFVVTTTITESPSTTSTGIRIVQEDYGVGYTSATFVLQKVGSTISTSQVLTIDAGLASQVEDAFTHTTFPSESLDLVPSPSSTISQSTSGTATPSFSSSTSSAIDTSSTLQASSGASNNSTTTTSLSSISPTSSPKIKNGLSSGSVAGVAIGCFVAGALIAALIAFFLLRSRRRDHRDYAPAAGFEMKDHLPPTPDTATTKRPSVAIANLPRGPTPTAAAAVAAGGATNAEDALPPAADDETLRNALIGLRTQINNHVLSFYKSNPSQEQVSLDSLSAVLAGSGAPPENIQVLLRTHRTRAAAMRFIVACFVTSRLPGGVAGQSSTFLPAEVASCENLISANQTESNDALLARWRAITAHLVTSSSDQSEDGSQDRKVADAVNALDSILKTYAKGDTGERLRNLEEIMKRAERLALILFAQPHGLQFDWQRAEQGIVVFPGLFQTDDGHGEILLPERVILERDIVRV